MIAVVYFSGSGHTAKLASLLAGGVVDEPVSLIDVERISDADWQQLDRADVILFGAPTYMGSIAAGFKTFMDDSSDRWSDQVWADKLAGGFTVATYASGDKLTSLIQMSVFAAQHGMIWVGQNHLGPSAADKADVNWQGAWLGLMATSSRDKDLMIDAGDSKTARLFGARIEVAVKRWRIPAAQG
ncbi:MAG: flavodoxin family protein [Rhodobacterales bacterium]|jgi:NAD(P)H dehydrogenase (quinone)|nr:flavodoxin family protein [Pseudomonadota bacterium]MDA1286319.1 flavodoxin family protein [Pseudomonadota bacterium]